MKRNCTRVREDNPQRLLWNNNYAYNKHGQIMAAQKVERGVLFVDISRGIEGVVTGSGVHEVNTGQIIASYDYGLYDYVRTEEESAVRRELEAWAMENIEKVSGLEK